MNKLSLRPMIRIRNHRASKISSLIPKITRKYQGSLVMKKKRMKNTKTRRNSH